MARGNMNHLLNQRMAATQQASELQVSNDAYQKIFREAPPARSSFHINRLAVFTPHGLGVSTVIALLICLITKKGYIWFSGYKYTRDPRGFDILPDAAHGSSGFLTKKEMGEFLELGEAATVQGMMLGKYKAHGDDPDKYAVYAAHRMIPGDNNNLLCIGAPGSGKSRGFIIPFLMGCAQRGGVRVHHRSQGGAL